MARERKVAVEKKWKWNGLEVVRYVFCSPKIVRIGGITRVSHGTIRHSREAKTAITFYSIRPPL